MPFVYQMKTLRERSFYQYLCLGSTALFHISITERTACTDNGDSNSFRIDPELLIYYAIVFSKLNCTQKWFLAPFVNLGTTLYYLCRCYLTFGMQEDLGRAAHCLLVLVGVHFIFCYKEENSMRNAFYKEIDLLSTRDSFRRTLDSVPEALLIRNPESKELMFRNKTWKHDFVRFLNACFE